MIWLRYTASSIKLIVLVQDDCFPKLDSMDGNTANSHEAEESLLFHLSRKTQHESVYLFLPCVEADFVGSALVRESLGSSTGDDDKIYFFFTERSQEQTTTYSHSRVARVARVCKVSAGWKRCRVWFATGSEVLHQISLSEVLFDERKGAIIDEMLDGECICNKAPVWLEEQTV